ncbi:MAG: hypothetical protein IJX65_04710 [Alistipes sp.]|nr:hypothetical protein [Alistipes sp.]
MNNRLLQIIVVVATSILFTSCFEYLLDWEVTPQTEIVQIPQQGGTYYFSEFEYEQAGTTRAYNPGEIFKCYRYRLVLGDNIGDSLHSNQTYSLKFTVPANEGNAERDVVLEISKAKEFHLSEDGKYLDASVCDNANTSEEHWEEWQTVWRGVQAGKDNGDNDVSYTEYTLNTCEWNFSWGSVKEEGDIIIVNSDKELNNLITHLVCEEGCSYPSVDFAKYSLIVAYGGCRNGISNMSITDFAQTSATELALHIAITTNMTDEAPVWTKALIVDKLSEQSRVILDVDIK